MSRRSFSSLKKTLTLEEFEAFCKKITEEYAETGFDYARKFFCERYNITSPCYYRVMEYAVVNNLVEDLTITEIMQKSAFNQNLYYDGSGGTSLAKYNRLYDERCKNIAMEMNSEYVKNLVDEFIMNKRLTKYRLSCKYEIHTKTLDYVFEKAIEENLIDDDTKNALEDKLLSKEKGIKKEELKDRFTLLESKRERNKK